MWLAKLASYIASPSLAIDCEVPESKHSCTGLKFQVET